MVGAALREIVHLLQATRTRQVRLASGERTLHEMSRLPPHLIDDVNARGLPLEHRFPKLMTVRPPRNRSTNLMPIIKSIRLIDG